MFAENLNKIIRNKKTLVCVGLDTDIEKIPNFLHSEFDPLLAFNRAMIEATHEYVAAFKLNLAFYESLGVPGWELLEKTLRLIPRGVLVIADAKRGDIENTGRKYAETFFDTYNFDAITVTPYMGMDSVTPFLEYENKGVFILCLTSNPGSTDFQFLKTEDEPLYARVAQKIVGWNYLYGNCGLVVGGRIPMRSKRSASLPRTCPSWCRGWGRRGATWSR